MFWPSGRVVWIVVGRDYEYLIYPVVGYCSCLDFYFAVMEGKALMCHHLIAQRLAEILSWYDLIVEEDRFYHSLMEEWKKFETEEVKQSIVTEQKPPPLCPIRRSPCFREVCAW